MSLRRESEKCLTAVRIELATLVLLGRPPGKTKQDIFSLLKNCFVFEIIDKIYITHN